MQAILFDLSGNLADTVCQIMGNGLYVSKYQLELPKKEEMQRFIEKKFEKRWISANKEKNFSAKSG